MNYIFWPSLFRNNKGIDMSECSVADPNPGSGAFLTPGSGIPEHISESLETIFWGKNTVILLCGSESRMENFGSGKNIGWILNKKNLNLRQACFDEQLLAGESLLRVRGPATTRDTRIIITIFMVTQISRFQLSENKTTKSTFQVQIIFLEARQRSDDCSMPHLKKTTQEEGEGLKTWKSAHTLCRFL